ncbi:hypothetical protein [Polaromonas sp.]|uniref:hypothetical protein n=1 Tax=Polaromonas sp. TaxID=1869339 RepID=UPI001817847F|nr:hypothetical protein [Polaromonas sp.]NML85650.1 hypothetical protein [Polaromonas sp.]
MGKGIIQRVEKYQVAGQQVGWFTARMALTIDATPSCKRLPARPVKAKSVGPPGR